MYFTDVGARKFCWEWYFSELLRLSIVLRLEMPAHAVYGIVGGHKRQVV